jgi:hypothetical protein
MSSKLVPKNEHPKIFHELARPSKTHVFSIQSLLLDILRKEKARKRRKKSHANRITSHLGQQSAKHLGQLQILSL